MPRLRKVTDSYTGETLEVSVAEVAFPGQNPRSFYRTAERRDVSYLVLAEDESYTVYRKDQWSLINLIATTDIARARSIADYCLRHDADVLAAFDSLASLTTPDASAMLALLDTLLSLP